MRRLLFLFLGLAGLTWAAVLALGDRPTPHNFAGRCEECHLTAPAAGQKDIFVLDIDVLCRRCHDISVKNSHPSRVAVPSGMAVPATFPLDWDGRITCTTCHDPHIKDLAANPDMLRGGMGGRTFCEQCHPALATSSDRHLMMASFAHQGTAKTASAETLGKGLDEVSLACLGCHEGSVGPAAGYSLGGQKGLDFRGTNFSHPIGLNYASAAARDRKLRSPDDLPSFIGLVDGKLGCSSCHSPFSHQPNMLVESNERSALCFECHLM